MLYPVLATVLTCEKCQKYVPDYDWDTHTGTGEPKPWGNAPHLRERLQERAPGAPLPCDRCPKESPAKEREHLLSDKNARTFSVFLEVQASFGQCLTQDEREDPLLRRNLAIVANVARQVEQDQLARKIARGIYFRPAGGA